MKQSKLLEMLETVLVVTVITALIWLYAEGETIQTQSKKIKVRLVPPTAGLVVSIPGQPATETGIASVTVTASLQASRGDWPRINDWLRENEVDIEVRTPTASTEEQTIDVRQELNESPLADINAFVKEVDQPNLSARIQQLRQVQMGVLAEIGTLELSDEEPTFNPSRVVVSMPAELAEQVREQNLKLTGRLDLLDESTLVEDTQEVANVQLDLPTELQDLPFVRPEQDRIDVTFVVRKLTEELVLPRVQVRLLLSDEITGKYDIKIDPESQRIISVSLSGPAETIRRIQEDQGLVRASIRIKLGDLTSQDNHAAQLLIDAPDGVEATATESDLTTITYKAIELTPQP